MPNYRVTYTRTDVLYVTNRYVADIDVHSEAAAKALVMTGCIGEAEGAEFVEHVDDTAHPQFRPDYDVEDVAEIEGASSLRLTSDDMTRIGRALVDYTIALNDEIDRETDKAEWAVAELDEVAEMAQRLGLED